MKYRLKPQSKKAIIQMIIFASAILIMGTFIDESFKEIDLSFLNETVEIDLKESWDFPVNGMIFIIFLSVTWQLVRMIIMFSFGIYVGYYFQRRRTKKGEMK